MKDESARDQHQRAEFLRSQASLIRCSDHYDQLHCVSLHLAARGWQLCSRPPGQATHVLAASRSSMFLASPSLLARSHLFSADTRPPARIIWMSGACVQQAGRCDAGIPARFAALQRGSAGDFGRLPAFKTSNRRSVAPARSRPPRFAYGTFRRQSAARMGPAGGRRTGAVPDCSRPTDTILW